MQFGIIIPSAGAIKKNINEKLVESCNVANTGPQNQIFNPTLQYNGFCTCHFVPALTLL